MSQEDLKQLETTKHKFCTSAWKFVSYAFFVGYGIYALKDQQSWLWSPSQYPFCYPNNQMPHLLHLYYIMATSYYAYASVSIFFEPKMKDRNEMLLHHGVTLSLLVSSYVGNVTKYGLAILLLHDIADPWMEIAKLCFYNKLKMVRIRRLRTKFYNFCRCQISFSSFSPVPLFTLEFIFSLDSSFGPLRK